MYAEYNLIDWEKRLIERRELWLDASAGVKSNSDVHIWKKEDNGLKSSYYENKKVVMDFLDSGKRVKSFDYDSTREADREFYKFEHVVGKYHLNAKVKKNGSRVTLIKSILRG